MIISSLDFANALVYIVSFITMDSRPIILRLCVLTAGKSTIQRMTIPTNLDAIQSAKRRGWSLWRIFCAISQSCPFCGASDILLNLYPCELKTFGVTLKSSEHVFQYLKAVRSWDIPSANAIQSASVAKKPKAIWTQKELIRSRQNQKDWNIATSTRWLNWCVIYIYIHWMVMAVSQTWWPLSRQM